MTSSAEFHEVPGGVAAPRGFVAAGRSAGIRKVKKDVAIIFSETDAQAAALFTTNKTVAACVVQGREKLRLSPRCRAFVVNSGNANACTGERGMADTITMAKTSAEALHIDASEVLVSSTGVIGQYMPMDKVVPGIKDVAGALSRDGSHDAAEAIMTTDTCAKEYALRFSVGGKDVTVGVIAKGSGMIAPNMATMLAFVTTDAAIAPDALRLALAAANKVSFNRLTVDGDMSTNDMVAILANGQAGNPTIAAGTPAWNTFARALETVLVRMAKLIARDGEGATKLVEVRVTGAPTEEDAERAAKSIANSNLVKTAIHGADANWGRILAAVGYSGIEFSPDAVEISFNDLPVLRKNYEIVLDEERAKVELQKETIVVDVRLNAGNGSATVFTCDLSKDYVHINASYRS